MPELPEVETTRRGLTPHVVGKRITEVRVRDARLRWPVPDNYAELLRGTRIVAIERRAKYLLWHTTRGTSIVHLGMSGSLQRRRHASTTTSNGNSIPAWWCDCMIRAVLAACYGQTIPTRTNC